MKLSIPAPPSGHFSAEINSHANKEAVFRVVDTGLKDAADEEEVCVPVMRLGLIGDNIARSQSPRLHVEAGRLCGIEVTYELLVPPDL